MNKRIEFDKKTTDKLFKNCGGHCSNPACDRLTSMESEGDEEGKTILLGEAAHIVASRKASGPRSNPSMSDKEIKSYKNAIWLCSNCHKIIDKDFKHYPVELLKSWKRQANRKQRERVLHGDKNMANTNIIDSNINIDNSVTINQNSNLSITSLEDTKFILEKFIDTFAKENIKKIIEDVLANLPNKKIEINNKDLLMKFINDGSMISDIDIQKIWSKLLQEENNNNGSVSKNTLDIVKNLSKDDALLFNKVASCSSDNGIIFKDVFCQFTIDEIMALQDLKLINSMDLVSRDIEINANNYNIQSYGDYGLYIFNKKNINNKFHMESYVLTKAGKELMKALNIKISLENIIKLGNHLKKINTNFEFKVLKKKGINMNNQDVYFDFDLLINK